MKPSRTGSMAKGPRPAPPTTPPRYDPDRDIRPMVKIDSSWKSLPGWPRRCPGAGRVGRAWHAVDDLDRALLSAWIVAGGPERPAPRVMQWAEDHDLLALADHPATGAAVREAITAAVYTSRWVGVDLAGQAPTDMLQTPA